MNEIKNTINPATLFSCFSLNMLNSLNKFSIAQNKRSK